LTAIGNYQKLTKNYAEDSDTTPQTWFQFFNGGDDKPNWTTGVYALRIDGNYYEGWDGDFNYQAGQFITPSNPGGAWPSPTVPGTDGGVPQTLIPYTLVTKSGAAFAQGEYRATDLVGSMAFDNTGVNNMAQTYPGTPRWFKVHLSYKF
jgi:hypothetical protein